MTIEDRNKAEIGDRVRVTYEGPVTDKNGYTIWIRGVALDTYNTLAQVEIIEKAKPKLKVGDKLKPLDFPDLPEHTVLQHSREGQTIVKLGGRWHYAGSPTTLGFGDKAPSWDTFTLVFLP